jgi:hypothetical protein
MILLTSFHVFSQHSWMLSLLFSFFVALRYAALYHTPERFYKIILKGFRPGIPYPPSGVRLCAAGIVACRATICASRFAMILMQAGKPERNREG